MKTPTSTHQDPREVHPAERTVPDRGWNHLARRMVTTALLLDQPNTAETTIGRVWLRATGGIRGCVETLAPGLAFLAIYITGAPGILALTASALIATVLRLF